MTPAELFKKAQEDLDALYGGPVTYQDIKNLIAEMGHRRIQRERELRQLLDAKYLEQMDALKKRCGGLGHIFDNELAYGVRCIVCGERKAVTASEVEAQQ